MCEMIKCDSICVDGFIRVNRRYLLAWILALALASPTMPAFAKDGDNSGSGGGGGNSGPGGGDDDDDDDDDDDRDDDDEGDSNKGRDEVAAAVAKGEIAPLAAVLKVALERVPGKILSVKLRRNLLTRIYEIKILTKPGRKQNVRVNAKSLKIVSVK